MSTDISSPTQNKRNRIHSVHDPSIPNTVSENDTKPLIFTGPETFALSTKFLYQDQQIRTNSTSNKVVPLPNNQYKVLNPKGKVLYEGQMKDNQKHGFGKEFFQSGKLSYSGPFKNNVYHGDNCNVFYYTGGIYYKGKMVNGKKQGYGTLYNKSGTVKYEGNFLNDHLHGSYCVCYDDKGNLEYVGGYNMGLKEGEDCTDYSKCNGLILFKGGYKEGKKHGKHCEKYYENGTVEYSGGFDMGIYNGFGREFHKNGPIKYEGYFYEGMYDGDECRVYHSTDVLAFKGRMIRGVKVGFCTEWYDTGRLMYEFDYGDPRKRSYQSQLGLSRRPESVNSPYFKDYMKSIKKLSSSVDISEKQLNNIYESENYGASDTNTVQKCFWRNGNLKYIGFVDKFKQKNGKGKYYDVNGNLYFIGEFRDNKFEGGDNSYYHTNGMLRFQGESVNGMFREGVEFHKNGKFKFRGRYSRCKPDFDKFNIEYYSNGQIMKIGKNKVLEKEEEMIEEKRCDANVDNKKEDEVDQERFEGIEYCKEGIDKREMERRLREQERRRNERINYMVNAIRN